MFIHCCKHVRNVMKRKENGSDTNEGEPESRVPLLTLRLSAAEWVDCPALQWSTAAQPTCQRRRPDGSAAALKAPSERRHHRRLASLFPCSAHRVNVKISHSRCPGSAVITIGNTKAV